MGPISFFMNSFPFKHLNKFPLNLNSGATLRLRPWILCSFISEHFWLGRAIIVGWVSFFRVDVKPGETLQGKAEMRNGSSHNLGHQSVPPKRRASFSLDKTLVESLCPDGEFQCSRNHKRSCESASHILLICAQISGQTNYPLFCYLLFTTVNDGTDAAPRYGFYWPMYDDRYWLPFLIVVVGCRLYGPCLRSQLDSFICILIIKLVWARKFWGGKKCINPKRYITETVQHKILYSLGDSKLQQTKLHVLSKDLSCLIQKIRHLFNK